jgi:glycosyltransferase involved in cell wall biosynthesis
MKPRVFVWIGGLKGGFEQRTIEFCEFLRKRYRITPTIGLYRKNRDACVELPYPKIFLRQLLPDRLTGFANIIASIRLSFREDVKGFDVCFGKYLSIKPITVTRIAGDVRSWYRGERNPITKLANFLVVQTLKRLIKKADIVTTSSDAGLAYAKGIGCSNVIQSSDFVNTVVFKPSKQAIMEKPLKVLFVGRSHEASKNLSSLIAACESLSGTELHIVGMEGQDSGNLRFHGWLSHGELSKLMNKVHLCVVPSHYETFGVVVIEALACNTPVLSSRNVPVALQIPGLNLTGTDTRSIKEGIQRIREHYGSVQKATEKAHRNVVEKFSKDVVLTEEIDRILAMLPRVRRELEK